MIPIKPFFAECKKPVYNKVTYEDLQPILDHLHPDERRRVADALICFASYHAVMFAYDDLQNQKHIGDEDEEESGQSDCPDNKRSVKKNNDL